MKFDGQSAMLGLISWIMALENLDDNVDIKKDLGEYKK
jgi:hypothetical protein